MKTKCIFGTDEVVIFPTLISLKRFEINDYNFVVYQNLVFSLLHFNNIETPIKFYMRSESSSNSVAVMKLYNVHKKEMNLPIYKERSLV